MITIFVLIAIYLGCGFIYSELFIINMAPEDIISFRFKKRKDKIIMFSLIPIVWIILAAIRFIVTIKDFK